MLHAAALQSRHGHARIASIDASRAPALRVHLVLTAADLGALNAPTPLLIPHPNLTAPRTQRPLVTGDVRYMGELVAFVIADDRYVAEDAVELIDVRYEPLTAAVDLENRRRRRRAGPPGRPGQPPGSPRAAGGRSRRRVRARGSRSVGAPLRRAQLRQSDRERGVVADYDTRTAMLRAWISTQAPLPLEDELAGLFGLPEFKVEVIAPDAAAPSAPEEDRAPGINSAPTPCSISVPWLVPATTFPAIPSFRAAPPEDPEIRRAALRSLRRPVLRLGSLSSLQDVHEAQPFQRARCSTTALGGGRRPRVRPPSPKTRERRP